MIARKEQGSAEGSNKKKRRGTAWILADLDRSKVIRKIGYAGEEKPIQGICACMHGWIGCRWGMMMAMMMMFVV